MESLAVLMQKRSFAAGFSKARQDIKDNFDVFEKRLSACLALLQN